MERRRLELYAIGLVQAHSGNPAAARTYATEMQSIDTDGVEFWTTVALYIGAAYPESRRHAAKAA